MNPSDQSNKDRAEPSGSELISYQANQTPIDFTEFLNIDDDQNLINMNPESEYDGGE